MKKVLQKRQFARKLIDHAPALRKRETTLMAADLRKTFGIPFSVRREAYRTIVSWKLGPRCVFHPKAATDSDPNPATESNRKPPPVPLETQPVAPIQSRPPIPKQTRHAGGLILGQFSFR